ncbi:MAG: hypothetical protein K2N13_00945 [Paraprevotella sp.]|nr:hypothetical protein [Paraprevotella sp.]
MTEIISLIVLSALLLVAVFFLGRVAYISGRRATTICNLKSKIKRYRMAADDISPIYSVRRIDAENSSHEYNGVWAVCRTSCQDGFIHNSCIKIFTDEDDEFNRNEAEELCEMLNSK